MTSAEKKALSERNICTKFITPSLTAGNKWNVMSQIREEVYFTRGRVIVRGQLSTRGEPTREIWYYEHPYPPGVKSYNKTKPIHISEFDAEKKWWGRAGQASKRKESELAWRVPIEQIKTSGYNLDIKNPNVVDPGHADPDKLLAEYQQLVKAVNDTREKLKRELQAALER